MHVILLAGGSGKRLWPLSNGVRAKVFLRLLPSPDGGTESMLERVVRQLDKVGLLSSALVVTHESQKELTLNQLRGRLPVVTEPHRRGTLSAAALAVLHLQESGQSKPEDIVTIMPADVYAEDDFLHTVASLPRILIDSGAELALIGTKPDRPSGEYGYIVPFALPGGPDSESPYHRIARFAEKPSIEEAQSLLTAGALWNCGVFAVRAGDLVERLRLMGLPDTRAELERKLEEQPELTFDREVAEKAAFGVVVPFRGSWHDLGNWETLSDKLGTRVLGIGSLSPDSDNTRLISELDIPVHIIGIRDAIVAAGPDGILVAAHGAGSRIKPLVPADGNVRIEEKRWGSRTILHRLTHPDGSHTRTSRIVMANGSQTSLHLHPGGNEILIVLAGEGEAAVDGQRHSVAAGDVVQLAAGTPHGLRARTELVCIEIHVVQTDGAGRPVRIAESW